MSCNDELIVDVQTISPRQNEEETSPEELLNNSENLSRIPYQANVLIKNAMKSSFSSGGDSPCVEGSSSQQGSLENVDGSPNNSVVENADDEEFEESTEPAVKVIEVKCGPLNASLHLKYFICPGIHQPCIELPDEPGYITPKAFTIKANKDKQKDWKGSIRVGKSNLRTLMEMRTIDFYNHSKYCSAKCQSRNYITPKEVYDVNGRRMSSSMKPIIPHNIHPVNNDVQQQTLGSLFKNPTFSQLLQFQQRMTGNNNNSQIQQHQQPFEANNQQINICSTIPFTVNESELTAKEELIDVESCTGFQKYQQAQKSSTEIDSLIESLNKEPAYFWTEMHQFGMTDKLIDLMIETLNSMRERVRQGHVVTVAPFLSRAVAALGMSDRATVTIRRRFSTSADAKHRLSTDFSSIEDNGNRKRSFHQDSVTPLLPPKVKKPKVQYPQPINPMHPTTSGTDNLLATILQLSSSPSEVLMQLAAKIAPLQTTTPIQFLPQISDSLLAIKH